MSDLDAEVLLQKLGLGGDHETPEFQFHARKVFALQLTQTLERIIRRGIVDQALIDDDEIAEVRRFIADLAGIRLVEPLRNYRPDCQFLQPIDRASQRVLSQVVSAAGTWFAISIEYRAKKFRREQEQANLAKRQERMRLRQERLARQERSATQRAASPEFHLSSKRKEEIPTCEKCHKRRIFKAGLCELCYRWERAKLGRR